MNEQLDIFAAATAEIEVSAEIIAFPLHRRVKMIRTVAGTLAKRVTEEGKTSFWNRTAAGLRTELKRRGLIFAGIDVISDYLTEINVTSPTGIWEILRFDGTDIASLIWDAIERRHQERA